MNYILYNTSEIVGRISCSEHDIEQNRNGNNYTVDSFEGHEIAELKVVNGLIQLKSSSEISTQKDADNLASIRSKRNNLLSESDWTQVTDNPLTDAQRQDWAAYRQNLRNITENNTDPLTIVWPDKPT